MLCGVSYGGIFAQRFVLTCPGKCAALIVVDSFSDTCPHNLKKLGLMVAANLGGSARNTAWASAWLRQSLQLYLFPCPMYLLGSKGLPEFVGATVRSIDLGTETPPSAYFGRSLNTLLVKVRNVFSQFSGGDSIGSQPFLGLKGRRVW